MSWNPRRFALMAKDKRFEGRPPDALLWVTSDTVTRIGAMLDAIEIPDTLLDATMRPPGFAVGFERGTPLPLHGAVAVLLHSTPIPMATRITKYAIRVSSEHSHADFTDPRWSVALALGLSEQGAPVWSTLRLLHPDHGSVQMLDPLNPDDVVKGLADLCTDEESRTLHAYLTAAWILFTSPTESEALAVHTTSVNVPSPKSGQPPSDVSVIDIKRAPSGGQDGGGSTDHDHRWEVSGHPRNQAYGPGRSLRKLIWVDEYVKGPADKPLVKKTKVHKV